MFKIVDCENLPEHRFRLVVETEDSSLFALLSVFESLVEFTGMFRYRASCAVKVEQNKAQRDVLYENARLERIEALKIYENAFGTQKEKLHIVHDELKSQGKEWMKLDDVMAMLRIARVERKERLENEQDRKKSA